MSNYNLHLDPSSRKYVCPKCGKKTFVVYLDQNRQIIDPTCGRCDRQDKCAYHLPPREFYAQSRTLTPYTSSYASSHTPARKFSYQAPDRKIEEPDFIPVDLVNEYLARSVENTTLFQSIVRKFEGFVPSELISEVFDMYMVSAADNGDVVFWQFDDQKRFRTGKRMGYDNDAHRNGRIQWMHRRVSDSFNLKQCFFGSHLLEDSSKIPLLFESEKTALIVATLLHLWGLDNLCPIATGGCGGLNPKAERLENPWDALAALKGRRVILFPDNGKYLEWSKKGAELQGFAQEVTIASIMEPLRHSSSLHNSNVPFETQALLSDLLHALPLGSDLADLVFAITQGWYPLRHLSIAMANYTCDPVSFTPK